MKSFADTAAQGEISIRRVTSVPKSVKPVTAENGWFVVGHSETGHHHVMERAGAQLFEAETAPAGMRILYAILDEPNTLTHMRDFDTHEPIRFQPGVYEFRLGREYDPYAELARGQMD